MQVRMKFKIEGTRDGVRWPAAGELIDLPAGEALDLVSSGAAELVDEVPEPAPAPEVRPAAVVTPQPETRPVVPEPRQQAPKRFGRR